MGRPLLRVVTCGSVDDGKSTLIGRLADDLGQVPEDERRAVAARAADGRLDHALLLDGLAAEREQGITIDVAHRALNVAGRRILLADAPGHEGYLRNTVTAASTADLAILLVDAARGIRQQTRRHAVIAALMRVRGIVLAVNKMDLIGHDQGRFEALAEEFRRFAAPLGLEGLVSIPIVALTGGNLAARDPAMPWYSGPTLTEHLATAEPADSAAAPFRMPVQWISRPGPEFRGAAGMIASGRLRPGDAVRVMPSGSPATVARIVAPEEDRPEAVAGES
jgi:bifunctional enzyme CysN/CysC